MSRTRREPPGAPPLKVVQVGLGGWGRSWADEMLRQPEVCRTVGYVDVVPEMLAALRKELPVDAAACFPTLAEALAATDAEAVLVTTALPGHAPVAIEALEAGRHVLVEKPFAPDLADARAMVDAARRAGRVLMVSQNYRFFPAPQVVAGLIARRELGALGAVSLSFRRNDNTADPRHHRHYFLPDALLLDMSIHHFDLMRFVLGQEPTRVYTVARDPRWSHFVGPASAVATIDFDGGTVVDYRGSWVSTAPETAWAGEWVMECERGVIRWTSRQDWTDSADSVTVQPFGGGEPRSLPLPKLSRIDRAGSMEEFWSAVREGRAPLTSGEANLPTLALALGAIESSSTCQPVRLG
ncbi:Gfo/Idh/MocA family protein [Naasia sp. SYSU D00057]|uniref:Gfo/Idh/MocA family protein n=1 Tax=Naasia sp. SYSU D00057 TaxID=2817380 RepID=UPI001B303890|nr:Gfo/Idh/MocA family oxidoreductase [Naasia sp. SYSU D00057]